MSALKNSLRTAFEAIGYEIRTTSRNRMPVEFSQAEKEAIWHVVDHELTMTSNERLWATVVACKHVIERGIQGDFVECGVWRGGHALLASAIFKIHQHPVNVYLFDTFEGMTEPTEKDKQSTSNTLAISEHKKKQKRDHNDWCFASLEEVKSNFAKANLLSDRVHFVKGDVLQTLNQESNIPDRIAILRLDTDWYESTKKELEVLYPRLTIGGVLLIDDYGHWSGSKEATDEYFEKHGNRPFLQYTDYSGRMGIKF